MPSTSGGVQRTAVRLEPSRMPERHRGLLTLPDSFAGPSAGLGVPAALRRLVMALPDPTGLVVAGHAAALRSVADWPEAARLHLRPIVIADDVDFTIWCQDACLSARNEGGAPILVVPSRNARRRDGFVAQAIADVLAIPVRRADFRFEGGNVLVGERFVFLGADIDRGESAADLLGATDGAPRRLVGIGIDGELAHGSLRLLREDGRLVVEEAFGHAGRRQPLFHVDLFMTVCGPDAEGRDVVLLGDSRQASRIAGAERLPLADQSLADALDETAASLERQDGLVVIRNPLPIVPIDEAGLRRWSRGRIERHYAGWQGLPDVLSALEREGQVLTVVRRWRAATQNGCLVFDGPSRRQVLLPGYASGRFAFLSAVEAENARIWRRLGFTVGVVPGCLPFAVENGSLHCLYKALPVEEMPGPSPGRSP